MNIKLYFTYLLKNLEIVTIKGLKEKCLKILQIESKFERKKKSLNNKPHKEYYIKLRNTTIKWSVSSLPPQKRKPYTDLIRSLKEWCERYHWIGN